MKQEILIRQLLATRAAVDAALAVLLADEEEVLETALTPTSESEAETEACAHPHAFDVSSLGGPSGKFCPDCRQNLN